MEAANLAQTVLICLPTQLNTQALDFIAKTFVYCPYKVLLGMPKTKKYRLPWLYPNSYNTFKLNRRNFVTIVKTFHIDYVIGSPVQSVYSQTTNTLTAHSS